MVAQLGSKMIMHKMHKTGIERIRIRNRCEHYCRLSSAISTIHGMNHAGSQTAKPPGFLIILGLVAGLGLIINGYGPILLAGLVGGLISRMVRVYRRSPVNPDYGLSWASVFSAPLIGALSACVDLHLLVLLQGAGILGSLGEMVKLMEKLPPTSAT